MEVANQSARCEHEASVSKVSDDQLFYLMSRGHTESESLAMIVNGFFEPFTRELPMEYAVELNKLMAFEMEGSIG
jgi:Fe-S cluster assembly protein SufB